MTYYVCTCVCAHTHMYYIVQFYRYGELIALPFFAYINLDDRVSLLPFSPPPPPNRLHMYVHLILVILYLFESKYVGFSKSMRYVIITSTGWMPMNRRCNGEMSDCYFRYSEMLGCIANKNRPKSISIKTIYYTLSLNKI